MLFYRIIYEHIAHYKRNSGFFARALADAQRRSLLYRGALDDLQGALSGLGRFINILVEPQLSLAKLQHQIRQHQVHIWHF